ncbi:MAG TPA: hypothetical protein VND93_00600, partial [Myxococcales bacterium]|nr:hypothetical protein [Myxococcales bacterium]
MCPSNDLLLQPLQLPHLRLENRVVRASVTSQGGIEWELRFARAGVGAIISPFIPVMPMAHPPAGCSSLHRLDAFPIWQDLIGRVHAHGCKYLIQLGHLGGELDHRRTPALELARRFAEVARRARETGADGIELHGGLVARPGDAHGELRLRYVVEQVRAAVGNDFHLQLSLDGSVQSSIPLVRALHAEGIDAVHVTSWNAFPPAPGAGAAAETPRVEIANLAESRRLKQALGIPVLCNGRFHDPVSVWRALEDGACDAVTLARPL